MIDVVTGHIVFHGNHRRSKGPVHVVHSENWAVVCQLLLLKSSDIQQVSLTGVGNVHASHLFYWFKLWL